MKKYIKPESNIENIIDEILFIATSVGVQSDDALGNAYNEDDISYSKDRSNYKHDSLGWDF